MTKRGTGSHCFDNDMLRSIYDEYEDCAYCGMAGADCFDHVEPRAGKYTDSIVNAAPVHNQKCNIDKHGAMHSPMMKEALIKRNLLRLFREQYTFIEVDTKYLEEYEPAHKALMELLDGV